MIDWRGEFSREMGEVELIWTVLAVTIVYCEISQYF